MKKFRKLLALVLVVCMVCAVSTTAWAEETTTTLPPISHPVDPSRLAQLIDTQQITYSENGYAVTERYNVYAPAVQPRAGVTTVTHEITKTVRDTAGDICFVAKLDADFECDQSANTVLCPRYYSSYSDIAPILYLEPYELDMEYKSGTSGSVAWYKVRAKTVYQVSAYSPTADSFWLTIGSDASGKKITKW